MMKLIEPTMEYDQQIQDFRREYLESGESMDGSSSLRKYEHTQEWLDQIEAFTTQYIYVREEDRKIVGVIQIRHRFNEFLEKYAGHIGYCVRPSERRRGYASQMLSLVLPHCREFGICDVLVCCLEDNEASRRTITANGGVYESTVLEPQSQRRIERYWIHLNNPLSTPTISGNNEVYLELSDTEWPFTYTDHDRMIVRAIVVDDDGYFYFVRAERDDDFGRATLIETSGGGVEAGEDLHEAIRRELREELGAEVEILCRLGVVSDDYNLIHRHNINNYFLCRVLSFGERHLMPDEIEQFHLSTLKVSYADAIAEYERCAKTPLGRLVANREMPVLRHAKTVLDTLSASAVFDDICTHLPPDEQNHANAFVRYLLDLHLHFHHDTSHCWRDKRYYWVMDGGDCVCFIAITDPDEPENRFTVWSDDMGDEALNAVVDDRVRTLAWQHIDHCGRCGSCGGGRHKVIFGRTFDDVCGCTFRVDNPDADDLQFLEEMVRIRITEIRKSQT